MKKLLVSVLVGFSAMTLLTGCLGLHHTGGTTSEAVSPSPGQPVIVGAQALQSSFDTSLTNGLIAYYPFNGDANDASGNGRGATLHNSPDFVDGPVSGTEAVHLVGQGEFGTGGQYITIPPIDLSSYSAFTISLWADIQGDASSDAGEFLIGLGQGHSDGSFTVGITYGPQGSPLGYGAGTATVGAKVPYLNQWHRYSLVYLNGVLTAYLDGQVLGTASGSMVSSAGNAGMGIHWWSFAPGVSTRFIGSLADVRIYNRALSSAEIQQLAGSKISVPIPSLQQPVVVGAQGLKFIGNAPNAPSLSLPSGGQLYVYGMATGGAARSGAFANGQSIQIPDANGNVSAELSATPNNRNSYTTSTANDAFGGFGVSGFNFAQGFYGVNPGPGPNLQASVQFSLSAPALVVVMGMGSSQATLTFSGLSNPTIDVSDQDGIHEPALSIEHQYLQAGTYTIHETTGDGTAYYQTPANEVDLIGVLIFSSHLNAATSPNAQIPIGSSSVPPSP